VVGWLDTLRSFVVVACLLAALLGFASAVLSGVHVATLLLVPVAMLIAALSSPPILLLLALVILAAHGLVLTAAAVGSFLQRRDPADANRAGAAAPPASLSHETWLRRRYLAGEIDYLEFRTAMLAVLKDRCAQGDLALADYEHAVERLLQPARHLGVRDTTAPGIVPHQS
jgi:hypothetical protein